MWPIFPEVTYLNLFYRLRFGYISRTIVSLDSYPKALAGEIGRIQMECLATQANVKSWRSKREATTISIHLLGWYQAVKKLRFWASPSNVTANFQCTWRTNLLKLTNPYISLKRCAKKGTVSQKPGNDTHSGVGIISGAEIYDEIYDVFIAHRNDI